MPTRFCEIGIDAHDVFAQAQWWSEVLGWTVTIEDEDDDEAVVEPANNDGSALSLVFVPVPEPKSVKNRVHLDLTSQSLEHQAEQVDLFIAMGATRADIGQQKELPWVVLADPEGNEFCVLDPRDRYLGHGPLAAVVVDAADPGALARFWEHAAGWRLGFTAEKVVSLHHPSGSPPDLDFVLVRDAKQVKNRVHLDIAPAVRDDRDTEVARLLDLGATRVDIGQGTDVPWEVLADPEGNEFCVLNPR